MDNLNLKRVSGLAGASLPFFISKHFKKGCLVLPSNQSIADAAHALNFFTTKESKVFEFPNFQHGYELLREDPRNAFLRLLFQFELAHNKRLESRFVVTNALALSQKILTSKDLKKLSIQIKRSEWYERDQLIEDLKAIGYLQDELAQDEGFFSVRGHLIDLFSSFHDNPIRIEFFGDEVVSIRSFDSSTQRSQEELDSIEIRPCRELNLGKSNFERAKKKLKELGDARGVSREDREQVVWQLEHQRELMQSRLLLPAFAEQLTSVDQELPEDFPVIFVNPEKSLEELESSFEREQAQYDESDLLAYPPQELRSNPRKFLESAELQAYTELHPGTTNYNVLTYEQLRSRLIQAKNFKPLADLIRELKEQDFQVHLVFQTPKKMEALKDSLEELSEQVNWELGESFNSFSSKNFRRAYFNERDIFGTKRKPNQRHQNVSAGDFLREFSDLSEGDYIVHEEHGVAKYLGLVTLTIGNFKSEFVHLQYADNDKLYLPIYRIDQISRYVAGDGYAEPKLDRLGSQVFAKKKKKAKDDILKIAHELVEIAAKRQLNQIDRPQVDEDKYQDFCSLFAYELTPDQESTIRDIESDLTREVPIDRLICGDVGFGKTEVALRASFFRLLQGVQIAVLAPTTLLVEQHYNTFRRRMRNMNYRIERLSRFLSAKHQKQIIEDTKAGKIDILIGTHRLLQRDIEFKNLGMLVVDEEQRFGVKHKEKIKQLKSSVDILTLSATPIPRTLQMAIVGIRDLSLIVTPPDTREAVETQVGGFEEKIIKTAAERELARGGQIIFVHNRVKTIEKVKEDLQRILPDARIGVGHGQMDEHKLEEVMSKFIDQKYDVLLATSIVENGLDIPNANTLFVDHAEHFGLSDLYQLRGRVGRGNRKAYAYFLIRPETSLTVEASKRSQVIQSCTELGSGFKVATHDLEIRGSGNLLGEAQSGVISEVGLELYNQMLHESLLDLKSGKQTNVLPELNSGYTAYIPQDYIPDAPVRISTYRRLNMIASSRELLNLEDELLDRFGLYPAELENFCKLIQLRVYASALKAKSIDCFPGKLTLDLGPETPLDPAVLVKKLCSEVAFDRKGRLVFEFESATENKELLDGSKQKTPELYDFEQMRQFLLKLAKQANLEDL